MLRAICVSNRQQSFIHRIHKYMQPHFRNAQPVINGGGFHEQKVVTEEKERIFLDQLKIPSARDQDQPNVGPSVQNPRYKIFRFSFLLYELRY